MVTQQTGLYAYGTHTHTHIQSRHSLPVPQEERTMFTVSFVSRSLFVTHAPICMTLVVYSTFLIGAL